VKLAIKTFHRAIFTHLTNVATLFVTILVTQEHRGSLHFHFQTVLLVLLITRQILLPCNQRWRFRHSHSTPVLVAPLELALLLVVQRSQPPTDGTVELYISTIINYNAYEASFSLDSKCLERQAASSEESIVANLIPLAQQSSAALRQVL